MHQHHWLQTGKRGSKTGDGGIPSAMSVHQTTSSFHFKWDSYEGFNTLRDLVRSRMKREPDFDYGICYLHNLVRWELQDETWDAQERRHYEMPSLNLLITMLKMYPVFFTNQSVQFPDEVWALTDKGRESDILQDVIYSMRGDKLWSKTVYKQKVADDICNILGDSNYRWSTREIWFKIIDMH